MSFILLKVWIHWLKTLILNKVVQGSVWIAKGTEIGKNLLCN